jgi:hypothetical protein
MPSRRVKLSRANTSRGTEPFSVWSSARSGCTFQAADIAGLKAIFVQAKDQQAEQFYAKHGFIPSPGDPLHLFFPLDPLRK